MMDFMLSLQPKNITIEELNNGLWDAYQDYYSLKNIYGRLLKANAKNFIFSLTLNLRFHKFVNQRMSPYNSGIKRIY